MKHYQHDGAGIALPRNDDHAPLGDRVDPGIIAASCLGAELDPAECRVLADIMVARALQDGETLVTEGDANHALFLLACGRLAVTRRQEHQEIRLYVMKQGECAGTRAFVDRAPRTAKLRASGDAVVYSMAPDAFETLLKTHPVVVYKVMRALFRVTHTNLMRMNQESQQLSNYIRKAHGRY